MRTPRRPARLPGPRGDGSRRARRTLRRGGAGLAAELNAVLGGWPGVRITPMFGRWGYFVHGRLFGCFPLRVRDRDLWVRLSGRDQARALASPGVRPHRRFADRGWVELDVATPGDLPRALRWLRRGLEHVDRAGGAEDAGESGAPGRA